ncbi:hypothetical protein GIB67_022853 [Kingdonia uniflora]|uniref:FAD/NAD(P)-binding domain-containing protein n=1 Tax=Kingdonia uniflora TaxID=39325 RepID=A0A7J7P7B9_9MAGN|nr:hypothetical protein GIB67_022853 [Kingdonia uniflora]
MNKSRRRRQISQHTNHTSASEILRRYCKADMSDKPANLTKMAALLVLTAIVTERTMATVSEHSILDLHTIDVDGKQYTTKNILISVGGRPFIPDIPGSQYAIDSNAAIDLPSRPKKIIIIGGDYIVVESASIFNGLKSGVHLFIRQNNILRGNEEEVRDFVSEQISLSGIEFLTEEFPQAIIKAPDGSLSLKTNK